jgi:hypothetical protein
MSTTKGKSFKKLVNYKINDKFIKQFIESTFQKKRMRKPFYVYKQLVVIYDKRPKLVEDIFKNINYLGYWKDCFFALLAANVLAKSRNFNIIKFTDFMYNFLIETLNNDINNFDRRKKISMLAKWLPRENRSFDKKLNFVDNFTAMRYRKYNYNVGGDNLIRRKVEYRKELGKLNKYLGTGEINFSNANIINEIDFNKISPICLKRFRNKIIGTPELLEKYTTFLKLKYANIGFWKLVNDAAFVVEDDWALEKEIISESFEKAKDNYIEEFKFILPDSNNFDCLVELSNDICSNNYLIFVIGITLLRKYGKVFCIGKNRELNMNGGIFNAINNIKKNTFPYVNDVEYNLTSPNLFVVCMKGRDLIVPKKNVKYWYLDNIVYNAEDGNIIGIPFVKKNKCKEAIDKILSKHFPENKSTLVKNIESELEFEEPQVIPYVTMMLFVMYLLKILFI